MRKLLIALALSLTAGLIHADETIGFKKGDRVVFVGPTFVERTARFGHLETALTLAMPEKELIFRNLGWSADTVMGESRGYEKPQSGYANLLRSIRESKPTLLFLAYGPSESWAATPETFTANYQKTAQRSKRPRCSKSSRLSLSAGELGATYAQSHRTQ